MSERPAAAARSWLPILLALVAGGIALQYTLLILRPYAESSSALHDQIIAGTAPSPYSYRVLVPFLMEGAFALVPFLPERVAFVGGYAAFAALGIAFSLIAIHSWTARWCRPWPALAATLLLGAVWPVAMRNHLFQPWSLVEPGIVALALHWIEERRFARLLGLVAVATLNRETAVFLVLAFLAYRWNERPWARAALLLAAWAVVFVGLRLARGAAPHPFDAAFHLAGNLSAGGLGRTALNFTLLLGPLVPFAVLGFRRSPPALRRLLVFAVAQALAAWGFAYWAEVRLLLPIAPVALPWIAFGLERLVEGSGDHPTIQSSGRR